MNIRIGKLRSGRQHNQKSIVQKSLHKTNIDVILGRVANAAQLGLLLLAAFGYFYTVIPVYQKSLLDEEIAKKTLELNARNNELQSKTIELTELNLSVSKARELAHRSQIEVGKLKGTVQEQYSELQPRLLQEFQLLGSKLCKLESIPEGNFAKCIREQVLSTHNLLGLTISDRNLLQSLVEQENQGIHASWKEFSTSLQEKRRKTEARKNELIEKCNQMRLSESYKDRNKKLSIDYQCDQDAINSYFDSIKIDSEIQATSEHLLASRLSYIVKNFHSRTIRQ